MLSWLKSRLGRTTPQALFLNNTADIYHWGCFGTSMMIYRALEDRGFQVTSFNALETHREFGNAPAAPDDKAIQAYFSSLKGIKPNLVKAFQASDFLVVNGEGTLHRFGPAPRALLSLMRLATLVGKPVHLINHACYPSGEAEPAAREVEDFYRHCLKDVDRIVVREDWSAQPYERWGLPAVSGFDCLPLYCARYLPDIPDMPRSLVLGGASWWTHEDAENLGRTFNRLLSQDSRVIFLAGGNDKEPEEDDGHFQALRIGLPRLEIVRPATLDEWMGWIKSAEVLVTGRFHHAIAGAITSTPMVTTKGNTPKTDAVCAMLGLPPPLSLKEPGFEDELALRLSSPAKVRPEKMDALREKAKLNLHF